MDILSHGLWGGVAFGRKNRRSFWAAFSFGVLPDLLSFGPFFALVFLGLAQRPSFANEPPDPSLIPTYVHQIYSITHSLPVFALGFALLWLFFRRPVWEAMAWGIHILLDIVTHSYEFFPTPFLWPLSRFEFDGWPWAGPWIFFPNIALLAVFYAWYFLSRRKTATIE